MSAATIPAIGDTYKCTHLASHADRWYATGRADGHRYLNTGQPKRGLLSPRECDPHATGGCVKCYDQREDRESTVSTLAYYMDNSVEVWLEDGTCHEVIAPHGDRCYWQCPHRHNIPLALNEEDTMIDNRGSDYHQRKAAHSLQEARRLLRIAIGHLNEAERTYLSGGDWGEVAKLADRAFICGQKAILPLGRAGTHALRRSSFS